MERLDARRRIAIIGMGPRGLGAAEALAERVANSGPAVEVDCFDPIAWPGAGPNFRPTQAPECLLNLPLRAIDVGRAPAAAQPAVPLADWLGPAADPERYPARAELGAYLAARLRALLQSEAPAFRIALHALSLDGLERIDEGWRLCCGERRFGPFDDVLLTLGQPDTAIDDQRARWEQHAAARRLDLVSAYPDDRLLEAARGWRGRSVGVRGLGLTTFDILRLLTIAQGGRLENARYRRSGAEPARILPFSLTGRPPAPKPATAAVDARFEPRDGETQAFENALARAVATTAPEAPLDPIAAALAPTILRVLSDLGADASARDVDDWLRIERRRPATQTDDQPADLLRKEIAMAAGEAAPSIGFAAGQLWRKWQNHLRRGFNAAAVEPETARALIGFDDGLKRFSYGPPIESARLLAALVEDGLVRLTVADDPHVDLTETGWRLVDGEAETEVAAMIDGVLPSPGLDCVMAPPIERLKRERRIAPVADGLGARAGPDGQLIGADGDPQPGLSLLGRLALGSVIAVDSIHDCFGAAATRWAAAVVARCGTRSG